MQFQSDNEPVAMAQRKHVQALLTHFDAQEAALLAFKSLLVDIGNSQDEDAEQRRLRVRIDAASDLCSRLNQDCGLLVQTAAAAFGIPSADFSVRHLVRLYENTEPTLAQALRESRRRLLRLTRQVRGISANTAWILSERRQIRHAVFQHVGGEVASDRYDSSGRLSMSPDSVKFNARS